MLDFSKVGRRNFVYDFLYGYLALAYRFIYCRKFQVEGRKNVPRKGRGKEGFLVICNHQNGLVDAMGITYAIAPHKPVFIARGDIFKKEFVGKLLRMLHILPAYRKRDTGNENLDKNEIIFQHAANVMKEGGVVALFPEAGHQDRHYLGTFKKGFARIAFEYEKECDFAKDLKILPLGHHYSGYFGMQNDLLITIDEPISFADLYETYKEHPERGRYLLNERARERVDNLILNIDTTDESDAWAVEQLCQMYTPVYIKKNGLRRGRLKNQLEACRALNAELKDAAYGKPEGEPSPKASRVAELIAKARTYVDNLKKLRLDDRIVGRANVLGFISRTLLWIVLLPIFLASTIIHFVPCNLGTWLSRKIQDKMLIPSFQLGVGALTYLIWIPLVFALVWIFTGKFWIALIVLLTMPLTLLVYHNVAALTGKLVNRWRKFWLKIRKDKLYADTAALRRDIMSDLDAVMA
ncbi:MAG: 1-acyl-sn-glycerol-3-phosphate acyltransferase [Bacteroidales bacterium]|nr:1-acyl-sn-glycerol-3-phosphate acyltransferase [Bacteroidales bacterium]